MKRIEEEIQRVIETLFTGGSQKRVGGEKKKDRKNKKPG